MIKLIVRTLLLFVISFLVGCGLTEVKETTYTSVQDGAASAKIINQPFNTRLLALDSKKIPHPTFGTPFNTLVTAPGKRRLTVRYSDGEFHLNGGAVIFASVEAGKTYALFSEIIGRRISYSLRDLSTNKVVRAPFLSSGLQTRFLLRYGL